MLDLRRLLLCAVLLAPACSVASVPEVAAHVGGYSSGVDGRVSTVTKAPVGSSSLSMGQLGQTSSQFNAQGDVRLDLTPVFISLSAFDYAQTGIGALPTVNFLGNVFTGSVLSDFDIRALKATVGVNIVDLDMVSAGLLIGVDYYDVNISLQQIPTGVRSQIDEGLPIPVLGIRADVSPIDMIRIGGEISGIDITVEDFDAKLLDIEAAVYFTPLDPVEIVLGYRDTTMEFSGPLDGNNDAAAELGFSGPFFGVGVRF